MYLSTGSMHFYKTPVLFPMPQTMQSPPTVLPVFQQWG